MKVCINLPSSLYRHFKKLKDKGVIEGSLEEVIIEAFKEYLGEIETYEKVADMAEEVFS